MRHIIQKNIKFDTDMPPLNQQQLFEHNLDVCKYKLDHLRSKAKLKKNFQKQQWQWLHSIGEEIIKKECHPIWQDLQRSATARSSIHHQRARRCYNFANWGVIQNKSVVSAKNMALGESKSDKGPTRSSFERLLLKISQGSRGHLVEM